MAPWALVGADAMRALDRHTIEELGVPGEVLMESAAPAAEPEGAAAQEESQEAVPSSPQTLRDLADLEEARSQGKVTEAEYARRREEILKRRE